MQHPKPPKSFGTAHDLPVDLAFSTCGGLLSRPKEGALHLIDIL
jgi:hypothetical protein